MDFIADLTQFFGELLSFFQTGLQYIIDFFQMWFGIGPYGQYAPAAYMLILLMILIAVGYRAIDEISGDQILDYYYKQRRKYKQYKGQYKRKYD